MTRDLDEEPTDPIFEALWARVLEAWDDDKPHAALLEHALRHEKLPQASGRYRALKTDPTKAARAQKKLDGIVAAATQMLFAMKTPVAKKPPRWITLAAALLCAALMAMLAWAMMRPR